MSHPEQRHFCSYVKDRWPVYFKDKNVLDVGSLDINGNNRGLFENCNYLGIDVAPGNNVDLVACGNDYNAPDGFFDVIISTECFEHDMHWNDTIKNIIRMLKSGGMFMFTCATTGRSEHGTSRTLPADSPLTSTMEDWKDYYKNLEESDIKSIVNVDEIFSAHEFAVNKHSNDLYFWGVKK